MRRGQGRGARFWIAVLAAAVTALFLVLSLDFSERTLAAFLLPVLMALCLFQATRSAIAASAGVFSEERRNRTLGLLFLAGVRPWEMFAAKLGGVGITGLAGTVAAGPGLAAAVLMARQPVGLWVACVGTVVAWFLLVAALNLWVSILFEDESTARLVADSTLVVLAGGLPALSGLNRLLTGAPLDSAWLVWSPAYAAWQLSTFGFTGRPLDGIAAGNLISLAYSVFFLAGASWGLGRVWQDQVGEGRTSGALGRRMARLRGRQRARARGFLAANPYAWLVARDYRPLVAAWVAIGLVAAVWLVGLWNWAALWLLPVNFWATCLVLDEVVRWLMHFLAARQIGEDRATGGLELILTSPLTPAEIVAGQELVQRRYVRPLYAVLIAVHLGFFVAGFFVRRWTLDGLASYAMGWIFVVACGPWMNGREHWKAFWVSLHTGRPGYALRRRLLQHGGYLSLWIQVYLHFDKLAGFPYGTRMEVLIMGSLLIVGIILFPFMRGKVSLGPKIVEEMREVAQRSPPDPGDPDLKQWNPAESFYRPKEEKILV